jgi:hypothetical protein
MAAADRRDDQSGAQQDRRTGPLHDSHGSRIQFPVLAERIAPLCG